MTKKLVLLGFCGCVVLFSAACGVLQTKQTSSLSAEEQVGEEQAGEEVTEASSLQEATFTPAPTATPSPAPLPTVVPTPEELEVIDVVGMTRETAEALLKSRGFVVTVVEEFSDDVEKGTIISQIPNLENGYTLYQGDAISLQVSRGADDSKAYLSKKLYLEEKTGSQHNLFSLYDGKDNFDNDCKNALRFSITKDASRYTEKAQKEGGAAYAISYEIGGAYKSLVAQLTHQNVTGTIKVEIFGDDKLLFSQGITSSTYPFDLNLDIAEVRVITIKLSGLFEGHQDTSNIIFNDAYFE